MLCLNGFRHERFEPRRLNECVPETIRLNSRSHTCQAEPGTPSHEAEPVSAWPAVGFETAHESKQLHSLQAAAHNQAIPHNTSISLRKSCNSGLSDALPVPNRGSELNALTAKLESEGIPSIGDEDAVVHL